MTLLLCIVAGFSIAILSGKVAVELAAATAVLMLVLFGYLTPKEAFQGLSSPVVVTMLSVYCLGAALTATRVTDRIARLIIYLGRKHESVTTALLMGVGIVISSLMNNVATTALLLPVAASVSERSGILPSRLLLPLAIAAMLGGTTTLIGTAPNLVASEILSKEGLPPLSLLSFTPFGVVWCVIGVLCVVIIGRFTLPKISRPERIFREEDLPKLYRLDERLFALRVPSGALLDGMSIQESDFGHRLGLAVVAIERGPRRILAPTGSEVFHARDRLMVRGTRESVDALKSLRAESHAEETLHALSELEFEGEADDSFLGSEEVGVVEVVLSPRSTLIGKTVRELRFRERYDFQVLALFRDGQPIRQRLGDEALKFGDALLLHGPRNKIQILAEDPDFVLFSGVKRSFGRPERALLVISVFVALFPLLAFNIWPVEITTLLCAVVILLGGAVKLPELYRQIDWRMVLFLAFLLPIGTALDHANLPQVIEQGLQNSAVLSSPLSFLLLCMIATCVLSQALDGSLAVVVIAPVALHIAPRFGIDPYVATMVVAFSASMAFLHPVSHRALLLVMAPGGYQARDYFRLGLPLTILGFGLILLFSLWFS